MAHGASAQRARLSRTERVLQQFHEEDRFDQTYDWKMMVRLWPFLRPYLRYVVTSLAGGVVALCAVLVQPQVVAYLVDRGALGKDSDAIMNGGLALAGLVVVQQVAGFLQIYFAQLTGAKSLGDLRAHVFDFALNLRLAYFDRTPVGRIVTRVVNDSDAILELFSSGAFKAITDLAQLTAIAAILLYMDPLLALIAFSAAPPTALLVRWIRRHAREAFRTIRAKTSRMNATMNEQILGLTVVQAYGQQDAAASEFDEINVDYRDANIRAIKFEAIQDASVDMVQAICAASIVMALSVHPVSVGTLFAFNMYVLLFFEPVSALAQRYSLLQRAMSGAERIFAFLDVNEPDAPRMATAPDEPSDDVIAFENVTFEYKPGVPVLRDVSFRVAPGEKVALVGATGAGKTTVSALLARLYDAQQGVVRLRGRDVRAYERHDLRSSFAFVPQDVVLFPGSIASNVSAGLEPDLARVESVLRRIGAWHLLGSRDGGLDAPVDEQASNFSAGERQLIAFARALYRDAPILVLDEATASVDSETEATLQAALRELLRDRTAIVIAHRLSTVRVADRILAFHKGRLHESGTHEELLSAGGLYSRLHQLHFARHE